MQDDGIGRLVAAGRVRRAIVSWARSPAGPIQGLDQPFKALRERIAPRRRQRHARTRRNPLETGFISQPCHQLINDLRSCVLIDHRRILSRRGSTHPPHMPHPPRPVIRRASPMPSAIPYDTFPDAQFPMHNSRCTIPDCTPAVASFPGVPRGASSSYPHSPSRINRAGGCSGHSAGRARSRAHSDRFSAGIPRALLKENLDNSKSQGLLSHRSTRIRSCKYAMMNERSVKR